MLRSPTFSHPSPTARRQVPQLMLALLVMVVTNTQAQTTPPQATVNFGMMPFSSPLLVERDLGPLAQEISNAFSVPVQVRTRSHFLDYRATLMREEYELALVEPFDFVRLQANNSAYLPLLRRRGLVRALVLTNDDTVRTLADLRGRVVAFTAPGSAMAELGKDLLAREGLQVGDYTAQHAGDHGSCLQAVSNGRAAACVSASGVYVNSRNARKFPFRIVAQSRGIPGLVLIYHPRLAIPPADLRAWFFQLEKSEEGRNMLEKVFLRNLVPATLEEYAELTDFVLDSDGKLAPADQGVSIPGQPTADGAESEEQNADNKN